MPIAVITNTAFTKLSDGAKSACENELSVIVTHKNNDPINAISGLTEVDPLSSLKRSIAQFLNVIVLLFNYLIVYLLINIKQNNNYYSI
jgi:hypothetical protein